MSGLPYIERPRWSCALGGALAAAGNIPGVVPLLHAGPGCAGNFAWTNNGAAGLNVTGDCLALSVPSTNLQEAEIVFGGIERLREEIGEAREIMEGGLFFILTGCLPEVIGDDVRGLVDDLSRTGGTGGTAGLVLAQTPGFKGDSFFGYNEVLKTLFEKVAVKTRTKNPALVNVWGVPPTLDPFWRGNLRGLKNALALLGLEANVFFGPGAGLDSVKKAGSAALNVVVSALYGTGAAEYFQERHGTGFVRTNLPVGAEGTDRFLKIVGRALRIPARKISRVLDEASRADYDNLEPLVDVYNDMEAQRHALIVGDLNYAPALSDFFSNDLGWVPELAVVTNDLEPESQKAVLDHWRGTGGRVPERVLFEHRAGVIEEEALKIFGGTEAKYQNRPGPVFVAGSSLERSLAARLGAGHLSLAYPVANRAVLTRGYTGYEGGLTLTEDVLDACIAGR
ncbi:MAG: hypothetical protein LBO05_01110 [Deltaproteobacteria bacterium]|jgi:nitrogenase molybdenum-iron protein beta chain|nr:hypothetical protein [Deltaproteobacteria bacterium]